MFDNIGNKLKTTAQVCCWFIIGASVISGIALMGNRGGLLPGLMTMVLGSVLGWVGSFTLYGFGDLVESAAVLRDAELMRQHSASCEPLVHEKAAAAGHHTVKPTSGYSLSEMADRRQSGSTGGWRCKACGKQNSSTSLHCTSCGEDR